MKNSYQIRFLPIVRQDLADIADYLNEFSETAFSDLLEEVISTTGRISTNPRLFQAYAPVKLAYDLRRAVIGDYLLFYAVIDDRQEAIAMYVAHGSRNIPKRLRERIKKTVGEL